MTILTAPDCAMGFENRRFMPGEGVVLSDWMADQVTERLQDKHHTRVLASPARCYSRPLRIDKVSPGDSLATWRGCGIGDQMVWAGLLQIIADRCPGLRIRNYCLHPELWEGVPGLPFETAPDPIPFDDWQAADWHLTGEALYEDLQHPDQPDLWTCLLTAAGIDPDTVPHSARLPIAPCSPANHAQARQAIGMPPAAKGAAAPLDTPLQGADTCEAPVSPPPAIGAAPMSGHAASPPRAPSLAASAMAPLAEPDRGDAASALSPSVSANLPRGVRGDASPRPPEALSSSSPLILWQLRASTTIRSYPVRQTHAAMKLLIRAGHRVVATGTPHDLAEYGPLPPGVETLSVSLRVALAAVAHVHCLICPDSAFGWAGAAFGTPTISLWGSFLPTDRVGSYICHHPLVGSAPCAPCRKHEKPWLPPGCPEHGPKSPCRALASIHPSRIAAKALEILAP